MSNIVLPDIIVLRNRIRKVGRVRKWRTESVLPVDMAGIATVMGQK